MSKLCNLEIARTGLSEREATEAGFGYVTVSVQSALGRPTSREHST